MRVIVTGSRQWKNRMRIWEHLDLLSVSQDLTVVHGACPQGADRFAHDWFLVTHPRRKNAIEEPHPAPWKELGRSAGPVRNAHMVALGADMVLAYYAFCEDVTCSRYSEVHVTHGTESCVKAARDAGIEVVEFWA